MKYMQSIFWMVETGRTIAIVIDTLEKNQNGLDKA